ncbi:hyaluronan synthase [Streptohalobacillus salinus]|uniref:Hyaluronan synthase n=1 Tax=Streptohalobacillus salinus TaxID=621096 RepID=A0A2V3WBZ3_9BACI|nr:glycosyltransferase [Streptohalobacillus salinus]PXW92085.1 hyaluronan synthase [Streptohalobacillus salinus]
MSKREKFTLLRPERRMLSHVPDPEGIRHHLDRRGEDAGHQHADTNVKYKDVLHGRRYITGFPVALKRRKQTYHLRCVDISNTGMLVEERAERPLKLEEAARVEVKAKIPSGAMPEGYESSIHLKANVVRRFDKTIDGEAYTYVALQFEQPIDHYLNKKKWQLSIFSASLFLLFISFVIVLMRAESIIYFRFNKALYFYSIVAASFLLSRYVFGMLYRPYKLDMTYHPGVSIVIPAFNEEAWIERTIHSCLDQMYPLEQLEVIVVDDASTDQTEQKVRHALEKLNLLGERFNIHERLTYHRFSENRGKREALVTGTALSKHDLVVFVDSDSFLEPNAIANLVQPFKDPKMGGVAGRTDVENKYTNALTKLQTVRYYVAFRIMKAAESTFDAVTCLSGPLSCYRKALIERYQDDWLNQTFLGQKATFGDDRSMTNFILKHHRTSYQDQAVCSTVVPSSYRGFLKQQMRWKRSWLRESLRGLTFMWKKEPFMFLFFFIGLVVPILAPVIVLYNMVYVPLTYHVFPTTFLVGLTLMALMLSFAHLLFKRSNMWGFGLLFVIFYEFVLLWQMPVAWVTFWKSTWGTRETPEDIRAKEKANKRKVNRRLKRKLKADKASHGVK